MGLLDSNKINVKQRSGSNTLDLTQSDSFNIELNGVNYGCLRLEVFGITDSIDVIIGAAGGINQHSDNLPITDSFGTPQSITKNGVYYVDVIGCTSVNMSVRRRDSTATSPATINWALADKVAVQKIVAAKLDEIAGYVPAPVFEVTNKTYDVSTVHSLETFTNDQNCECLVVSVKSITNGAAFYVRDPFTNNELIGYTHTGELVVNITKPCIAYFPIPKNTSINLYNGVAAANGTTVVSIGWMAHLPDSVAAIKPHQLIATNKITITSSNSFEILSVAATNMAVYFKYYYINYILKDSENRGIEKTTHISVQPYINTSPGNSDEISLETKYCFTTPWQEVRGNRLRVYARVEDFSEGDTIELFLYGVR